VHEILIVANTVSAYLVFIIYFMGISPARKPEQFKRKLTWYQKKLRLMQVKLVLVFALLAVLAGLGLYYYQRKSLLP